ncbi:uncharacterized protein LOC142796207 isoform X2 [Rhipicephalus microplus]|uniref:uncharacterized protein LOC142796207 isoform X2 n=1 Tax=Rhipicephalus microplus TaxID=6941 RepID=UPI003F6C5C43
MSTRCLLCWPFWQFRRLYRKRRPRRLSSSLFLRASATTLTDDVFDFTVHLYSALQGTRRHRRGKARSKPCLCCYGSCGSNLASGSSKERFCRRCDS